MHKTHNNYTFFLIIDVQSDDDSSASVAEPGYSPDKEEGRMQVNVTDCDHLEQRNRKVSEKPWLSPCRDVPKQISSPLKCPDFKDKEDDEGNRQEKSKRTSIRKKPGEKHKSIGLLESPCQDRRSGNSKNFHKEKRKSQIKSSSPSPNKPEKGKRKIKAAKSFTETKTNFFPDTVNSSSCLLSPTKLEDAAFELSKETATPFNRIPKRARPSLSTLVRSFTLSGDSKSVASGSADGDDNVFEDYFSPANHLLKSKRTLLPDQSMERDVQIPFELESVPKKRKPRRSEIVGSETKSKKKRKLEESHRGKNCNQQSDASSESQSHAQQDVKESLPALDNPSASVTLVAKKRRQSTLSFTSTSTTTSDAVKPRRVSTSVRQTMLTEANTVLEQQKTSDVNVLSHTLESE